MSYDPKCYDLAELFLDDEPSSPDRSRRTGELAQLIQTTIEDWLESNPPIASGDATKTIVILCRRSAYKVTFPDGDYAWQPSKDFAEASAKQWFQDHNISGKIEWKSAG
jgi:hypothetical protein